MDIHGLDVTATPEPIAQLDRLGDEIAALSAHLEAATARLLDLIREFDIKGGWNNGFRSCAAWLSWRVGLDPGAARERVRVARALGTLPRLAQALARGELSYAKVRALTRVATPETEERLLAVGRAGTAEHVEHIVRSWRRVDRQAEARESTRQHARRWLHVYQGDDGMMVVRGRLEAEAGALLIRALAAARERLYQQRRNAQPVPPPAEPPAAAPALNEQPADALALRADGDLPDDVPTLDQHGVYELALLAPMIPPGDVPTIDQQQADALALLAETALHHELDPGAPGERYQVVVHVDAPVLADPDQPGQSVLEGGVRVPAETSRRIACDASRVVMRQDGAGHLVEIGARTRTIPPALRRALQHRDGGCRFPGCGVPFGQGHHLRHWANGGPTTLSNLAILCRRHHRAVHEEGFQVDREPDGALRFRRPDGQPVPDVPRSAPVPADPVGTLLAENEARGISVHARTGCASWLGERLDLGYAIDVLHPLANPQPATSWLSCP
jgi:5-methylcytosine-specific restriction endonuclease McrA